MKINDRINLLSNLYQSGANASQLLSDLHLLSNVLDHKSMTDEPPHSNDPDIYEYGLDAATQCTINKWSSIVQSINGESAINLYKFQRQFLTTTFYMPDTKQPLIKKGNYYLGAKGIGLTTAMVLHCARTLISTPNIEIIYLSPSNEKNEEFVKAVALVIDANLIHNKNAENIKMANGSKLTSTSYQAYSILIENNNAETAITANPIDQFIHRNGIPNILLLDDAEHVPFKHVKTLLNIGSKCDQFIISGHATKTHGMMYEILTNHKRNMNRNILPWWEGDLPNMDMVKTSFTNEQFNSLFCCQFMNINQNTATNVIKPGKVIDYRETIAKIHASEPTKLFGICTIDNILLDEGDLVLVNGQVNPSKNGVYVASKTKWNRYDQCSSAENISKTTIKITHGENYSNTNWVPNEIGKLDVDRIQYVQLVNTLTGWLNQINI